MVAPLLVDLAGRVAIVTGAASGIGRATALVFRSLGVRVLATDRDESGLADLAGSNGSGEIVTRRHDVASEADWDAVFDVVDAWGRLDILVNNAGVMRAGPFETSPLADLRDQYRINVEGPFLGMQGAIPRMRASIAAHGARPSIVNVSSIYGQVAGSRYAAYSASKGAVKMLSKAVAFELAGAGIRVNSVHPGPTSTRLGASHPPPRDADGVDLPPEQVLADWMRLIPMRRFAAADDIASVIACLASDAAGYMTGAEVVIDGGYTSA